MSKIDALGLCQSSTVDYLKRHFAKEMNVLNPSKLSVRPELRPHRARWQGRRRVPEPAIQLMAPTENIINLENEMLEYLSVEGTVNDLLRHVLSYGC